MALIQDRCLCLRKVEYSETSQILSLFGSERGLFRVIAKGAHRRTKLGSSRFDGGVDLLDIGSAVFTDPSEKELATLTEWKLIEGHLSLRSRLRGLHLAVYAAEVVGLVLQENDPHPELFDLLTWVLGELGGRTPRKRLSRSRSICGRWLPAGPGGMPDLVSAGEAGCGSRPRRQSRLFPIAAGAPVGGAEPPAADHTSCRSVGERAGPQTPRLTRRQSDPSTGC
jgi:DNA repair protein RecO (recombination protein O)